MNLVTLSAVPLLIIYNAVSSHSYKENERVFTEFGCTDFAEVLRKTTFVDKTLLIQAVFKQDPKVLIEAPFNFGKTTNINMLKRFLEIPVDEKGIRRILSETENFRLFRRNKLKIAENTKLFDDHFGQHPILYINFTCRFAIKSYSDAFLFCKDVIHETFKQYEFLVNSEKLTENERSLVEEWCDKDLIEKFEEIDTSLALKILSEILCTHFDGKKTFVLIDDYDSLLINSKYILEDEKDQRKILEFYVGLIGFLLKINHHLDRAILTGRTYWADITGNLQGINRFVNHFAFLENHEFFDYFGMTEDEVNSLFIASGIKIPEKFGNTTNSVRGYRSTHGRYIYSYNSVFRVLNLELSLKT